MKINSMSQKQIECEKKKCNVKIKCRNIDLNVNRNIVLFKYRILR